LSGVVWLPPSTPDDLTELYRSAFDKVLALPEFIDDYVKFVHAPPTWIHGPQSQAILDRLAGTDKSRLLSATIYLSDMSKKDEMNEVWKS
jgi:hypothetical protein